MAIYTLTPAQLKGAGVYNSFEIPAGGGIPSFSDVNSFLFDGVDDKIQSTSNFTNLDGQSYVGFSFWLKVPNVSSSNKNLLKINNSVSGYSFLVYVRTNGSLDASFGSSSSFTRSNSNAIMSNTWHHVFVRFDGTISSRYSRLRIFVNGALNHASSNFSNYTGFRNNSSDLLLSTNGSTAYSNCYLNEISFYTSGDDTLPNEIYNGGVANNLDDNSFTPIVWYRSENAIWNGTEWDLNDEKGNGVDLISRNMAESAKTTDVPI